MPKALTSVFSNISDQRTSVSRIDADAFADGAVKRAGAGVAVDDEGAPGLGACPLRTTCGRRIIFCNSAVDIF